MKKLLVLYLLIVVSLLVSCSKKEDPVPPPKLTLSKSSIVLTGNRNGKDSINIDFTGNWTASIEPANASWLSLDKTSGNGPSKLVITALQTNTTTASRSATIVVKPDNNTASANLAVTQQVYVLDMFRKAYGGSERDEFNSVAPSNDGGYVVAGMTLSSNGDITGSKGGQDALLIRFDVEGNVVWQRNFGGSGDENANSIVATTDGGFLVAGQTNSTAGDFTSVKGDYDYFILKIDGAGNKVWSKTYGGKSYDAAFSIITTTDGNYLVSGSSHSVDGDVTNQHTSPLRSPADAWVLKINGTGDIVWQKCYGSINSEAAFSAVNTADGGYLISGFTDTDVANGDVTATRGLLDIALFKVDGSGNLQWQKNYGGSDVDFSRDIKPANDGGYIVAGYTSSKNGDVTGYNGGVQDGWVFKIDVNGNMAWAKTFGTANNEDFASIAPMPNGYVLAGASASGSSSSTDAWSVRISNNGTLVSDKKHGGSDLDAFRHVLPLANGFYLLSGFTKSTEVGGVKGNEDGYIVRSNE